MNFNFDNSYLRLPQSLYRETNPAQAPNPELIFFNKALAQTLGLDFTNASTADLTNLFCGNVLPQGSQPIAQAYAGHQFSHFNTLGDGRAHLLGEHIAPQKKRWDIQLKGSGRTPYSRGGDGRAALGPMLREYIISEAMYELGIATSRSLAVVTTGEAVLRQREEPGAILTRVAASHIRVGTFEYARRDNNPDALKQLADYTIKRHFPEVIGSDQLYLNFFKAVTLKQLHLISEWMRVGFIHGVMNTDNVLISGETLDYGPCAFMDTYNPNTKFSSIDRQGRYAFGNQAPITLWNMARFAETLLPLIQAELNEDINAAAAQAETELKTVQANFNQIWLNMMRRKLGLTSQATTDEDKNKDEDKTLIRDLLEWLEKENLDYTNSFRDLSQQQLPEDPIYQSSAFLTWHERWLKRRAQQPITPEASIKLMQENNPAIIPRNHQVEIALTAAETENNLTPAKQLLAALKHPYQEKPTLKAYQNPPEPHEVVRATFCGT